MTANALLPCLINARQLKELQDRAGGLFADAAPVSESFTEDLHLAVSADTQGHGDLVRWSEVPRRAEYLDVIESACVDFYNSLPKGEPSFIPSASGLTSRVTYGRTGDSLLLIVGRFWRHTFVQCSGELLAAVPSSDSLFIADAAAQGARQELQELVNEVFASSNSPLSNRLVSFNGLKWCDV
jgi:hypothetical protein